MNTNENTTTDDTTTAIDAIAKQGPLMTHTSRLLAGNHPATVIGIRITRNHNGKLHTELDCSLGNRRLQHQMWMTSPESQANTARQLKNAFGIESFKEINKAVGQHCSLRIEEEEYNGRVTPKVRYVNPHTEVEVGDIDFDSLDAGFAAPAEVEIPF